MFFIDNITGSSNTSFTSIPQDYKVLLLHGTFQGDNQMTIRFNNDTSNNYEWVYSTASGRVFNNDATSLYGAVELTSSAIYIYNYSSNDSYTRVISLLGTTSNGGYLTGIYKSTNPITSIDLIDVGSINDVALWGI